MNTVEKGESFEKAVKTALIAFYEPSSLNEFVSIEHNVIEVGQSGQPHQIDIRLEIQVGIVKLKLLCECKCYGARVPLTDALALKSRVDDCNAAGGVLITNDGFQKGVVTYAKQNRITLLTLKGQEIVSSGGASGPGYRWRIWDVVTNLAKLFTFGGRTGPLSGQVIWPIVSTLAKIWPHPLPIGVELNLIRISQCWRARLLFPSSELVEAVDFEWKGLSIRFNNFDFQLEGNPSEFSDQQKTCFYDEEGFTIPGRAIKKTLVFKALMDHASIEQMKSRSWRTN